jgi:hypothetical protein
MGWWSKSWRGGEERLKRYWGKKKCDDILLGKSELGKVS